uniref:Voltage-dependent calcium channel subunit alpha-2/delta-4-like n=1 Tax=Saccoglossus kowalevskii TaxID=10224 RepID=A0ABM0MR70_SACKO|nr:PREDICTED: voltage-dependent calcium channel subunit alpha-2/delta-4-like [Saccoglossus kowalevskii]
MIVLLPIYKGSDPIQDFHKYYYTPCDKEYTFFHSVPNVDTSSLGVQDCGLCEQSFAYQSLPFSNLVLLVIDVTNCDCISNTTSFEPKKKVYNDTDLWQRLRAQSHRKRPLSCHSISEYEDSSNCGAGTSIQPSFLLILMALCYTWKCLYCYEHMQ